MASTRDREAMSKPGHQDAAARGQRVTRPAAWLIPVVVAALLPMGAAMFWIGGSEATSVVGLLVMAVALAGGVVAYSRGVLQFALGAALGVIGTGVVAVIAVVAILVFIRSSGDQSGLTYVNRTTVPIAVVDHGSRSIVGACSERTLRWSNSWGGDPSTGVPSAEPLPPGAYEVSAENFRPAPDGVFKVTVIITKVRIGQAYGDMPDPRGIPCEGVPPPRPSPSPSPSTR